MVTRLVGASKQQRGMGAIYERATASHRQNLWTDYKSQPKRPTAGPLPPVPPIGSCVNEYRDRRCAEREAATGHPDTHSGTQSIGADYRATCVRSG